VATSFEASALEKITVRAQAANQAYVNDFPGEVGTRQPVHTVYGGAQLFSPDTPKKLGSIALRNLESYGGDFATFARVIGLDGSETLPRNQDEILALAHALERGGDVSVGINPAAAKAMRIYQRVKEKLQHEAVEDFRIDFEDGYGIRPDSEEDAHAEQAAKALAQGAQGNTISPFIGIRIKPFSSELLKRSLRTLDIFVTTLVAELGKLPEGFVVTLPKITSDEHVAVLAEALQMLEKTNGLSAGSLKLELMIETTQSIIDSQGNVALPLLMKAAQGRCIAAHFGTYDYTACCNITAAYQIMTHDACDFARHMMQIAYAGTGLWLSDGATNVMPIGPHRAEKGAQLSPQQIEENMRVVHAAWRLHVDDIRHSLRNGYYQGWDLHPAQLPTRYAAVYSFFLDGLEAASERLSNFIDKAAQATLVGDVFDDAATGQGLLNFFLRGINCGALEEEEALRTGLTVDELRSRSFVKILENRRTN